MTEIDTLFIGELGILGLLLWAVTMIVRDLGAIRERLTTLEGKKQP